MSARGFLLWLLICPIMSIILVGSVLCSWIWQLFGNYILIMLAGIIIVKIAFKLRKSKHYKTLNA
jgi:hypothetical protein